MTKNIVQEDDLAPEADQSREKTSNLPKAFSHAREFDNDGPPPGVADNEAREWRFRLLLRTPGTDTNLV